jgi:hypothetical protein
MMNYHRIVWQEMQVLNAKNNGSQRGLIDISQKDCLEQAGCLFHKNYARGVMSYSVLFESIPRARNTRYESQKPFLPLPPSSPLPLGFLRRSCALACGDG